MNAGRTLEVVHDADLRRSLRRTPARVPIRRPRRRRRPRYLVQSPKPAFLRAALVKQDAVPPPERVCAADVERRVVDEVEGGGGRRRGGDVLEGVEEEGCAT